ncbi:MAG TPA: hypothetical protein VK897_08720 [Anaerolineales bacterium]|nr:hypothetical protein [Anaerolineales bacterium]
MPPTSDPITSILPGLVLTILIIAVPLAFFGSIGLLKLYRRAVIRAMRKSSHVQRAEPIAPDSSISSHETMKRSLQISAMESGTGTAASADKDSLYADLVRAPWKTAAIYGIAGLCYALMMTIVFIAANDDGFYPVRFLVLFWYYAWPVVVTIWLVAGATWRTRLIVLSIYFFILVFLVAIALVTNSVLNWRQLAALWLLTNFVIALVLFAFFNRRIRAMGPLVLTFMIIAVTGSLFTPLIVDNNTRFLSLLINLGNSLGLGVSGIFLGLFLLGFFVFGVIGWMVLQKIGDWYQNKRISEQSITLDAIWLLFGIFQSIGLIFEGERWFLASLLSFFVYKLVAWAGFAYVRRNRAADETPSKLLVLRVFSLGQRSERLFDVLGMYWRFVGSVQLIAGPDLATTTMEPHEFLDFLSGKLARRFIDNDQTLDLRISQMDLTPDYDGQFRVNDFFCYDDTWRMVLSRLVRESDAVIMDLRGFSAQNAGCIFEINELINLMPLGQVVFIIDGSTDEPFLRQVLQQSWEQMSPTSPNRLESSGMPRLLHLNRLGAPEVKRLLQVLSNAVKSPSEAQALA